MMSRLLVLVCFFLHLSLCYAWSKSGSRLLARFLPQKAWETTTTSPPTEATSRTIGMSTTRRHLLASVPLASSFLLLPQYPANAKCTDIDSCREVGERKDQARLDANPIIRLGDDGLVYKVLRAGVGDDTVSSGAKVNLIFSVSQANGSYMYSRGFGYNKIDVGDSKVSDLGLDSLMATMGKKDMPVGVQTAMMGMKRGERRRIECPPSVGFETSDWNPEPTSFRGRQQIKDYKSRLYGRGSTQPPFPAPTIWDVEVLSIR